MCGVCGCGSDAQGPKVALPSEKGHDHHHHEHDHHHDHGHHHHHGHDHHHHGHDHHHDHGHHHHHGHDHSHDHGRQAVVELEQNILHRNQLLAERNRGYFAAKNMLAINLVSSPGSGKTSVLERTLREMKDRTDFYVIEGDQQTFNDADRIDAVGVPVVQVNTGQGCHLESDMVQQALQKLKPRDGSLLFIENVGNLVCPAMFDLGENYRVVIISTTEGDDKPIKYPDMFHSAQLCLINKIDLLPYVNFEVEKAMDYARRVNPHIEFLEVSATNGEGMDAWYAWLEARQTENS
ncbi:hydrogenase nickel incorporation protein HypB [Phaeodactylibacter xiamenensis]|uniref:hydrogenase nickel incorporation protein HypB n=1 Tax=Phaeodactylibacter xiamenensis TaxID=1524460 RepID=UPI0024A83F7C|nr:hydrogenase nickel incorporation protein HypB [Phaeodactylibacter xiamenensis]